MPGSIDNQLQQSVLHVNALGVVHSADNDPDAAQILMKHLNLARKEMQLLFEEKSKNKQDNLSGGYSSAFSSKGCYDSDSGPESEGANDIVFGASGSSAYMSDSDILSIQAPPVPPKSVGRPRENRFPRMFEYRRTRCKKVNWNSDGT
ncbi:hypothetical protein PVAP13_7NG159300 [Panicum virgatum]|nr:hypothetical protein PVAP13_7NG159300 [Panicum virgatum]